ncbi:hypothetical protein [Anaeromyxobacter oryzisoli]|uniref:hypothetical protein n=1 Tax=Anaeromyxobacter oryzisoli TaxID=2925408 RepID=UPI001F56304B|nr:hypothetical protein [Anaeromyxobacter sp. SG63]
MKRVWHVVAAALFSVVASGCGPSDLISLGREPTLGQFASYLLLLPIFFVARIFLEDLIGEAVGMLLGRLLPPWIKTRRALWTGVAVMCLLTLAAVAYWNRAGRA